MPNRFCRLIAAFLLLASLLSGCVDQTAGQVFRFDILSEPTSIDPQTASSDEQYLVLLNTMEGLLKMDEAQNPIEAAPFEKDILRIERTEMGTSVLAGSCRLHPSDVYKRQAVKPRQPTAAHPDAPSLISYRLSLIHI